MNDARQPQIDTPQLRTLLLTDLCDSTELIEKLGDAPAAELFREHDTLVLNLQQEWRGRLIDRSDGLLLVFERPIDGLGFALDYQRGLDALGRQRKLLLRARAGLHVGEVLTWRNSDAAVQIGAKPHEVFVVLFLDAQNRLIRAEEMFRGTLTQTSVYPREVLKRALDLGAAAVLLAHNHPSGAAEPSRADEFLTQTLTKALALIDVRVLDHLVVSQAEVVSFAERGLL